MKNAVDAEILTMQEQCKMLYQNFQKILSDWSKISITKELEKNLHISFHTYYTKKIILESWRLWNQKTMSRKYLRIIEKNPSKEIK